VSGLQAAVPRVRGPRSPPRWAASRQGKAQRAAHWDRRTPARGELLLVVALSAQGHGAAKRLVLRVELHARGGAAGAGARRQAGMPPEVRRGAPEGERAGDVRGRRGGGTEGRHATNNDRGHAHCVGWPALLLLECPKPHELRGGVP